MRAISPRQAMPLFSRLPSNASGALTNPRRRRPRPDLACFPKDFGKRIAAEYGNAIEEMIALGFFTLRSLQAKSATSE